MRPFHAPKSLQNLLLHAVTPQQIAAEVPTQSLSSLTAKFSAKVRELFGVAKYIFDDPLPLGPYGSIYFLLASTGARGSGAGPDNYFEPDIGQS